MASTKIRGEYEHDYLPLEFRGQLRMTSRQSTRWFPLPPYPQRLSPTNMVFTDYQMAVLKFFYAWHWRWSPSQRDIEMNTVLPRHNIVWSTLTSLRSLDIVDWIDGEARTLHLTPVGQRLLGLYIGPLVLDSAKDAPIDVVYEVNTRKATQVQKALRRTHRRLKIRKGRGRWNRPPPLSRLRRWLVREVIKSARVKRQVQELPFNPLRQV